MAITSTCPGCGSSLTVDETAGEVVCPYCGNHFKVNLDNVNPTLQVAPLSNEVSNPEPVSPGDEIYNPPLPGSAPTSPIEVYDPPISNYGAGQPPFFAPTGQVPPPIVRTFFAGSRLWIALAIIAAVVLCTSCVCLVAVIERLFR